MMKGLEPSLLEKLFDDAPRADTIGSVYKLVSIDQYKESIARDLEGLLNSRAAYQEADIALYPNTRNSVLTYGLADFSSLSLSSGYDRAAICRSLELAIGRHEQRLRNVSVSLDACSQVGGGLHFTIHAVLDIKPTREPISFDAMLNSSTLQYQVSRGRRQQAA